MVVVSHDAADAVAGHRAGAVAGGEGAVVVVSRDAAGAVVGSGHCYPAVAGDEGAVVVASHDAAYVVVALHLALHAQALHRAAAIDVSEEALVVRAAAVDVDAGYGESRTVEGAGVLLGGVPYRRPVVGAFGQGDVLRQGGVQLEVVPAHVHEGSEAADLIGCAEDADGGSRWHLIRWPG